VTKVVEECAALALAGLADEVARRFADDPLGTLRNDLKLTVRAVDHLDDCRADGGVCDGVSYLRDGVVLYRTTGNRRENFTLAHELGHWLVDQTDDVYDKLADLDDPAKLLESVCDRIARLLLLPDDRLASVVPFAVVEARHVTDLYDATNASIHACVIALKDRLPALGAVLVLKQGEDNVLYASVRPDDELGWPKVYPWPGQTLPTGHPLRGIRPGGTLRQRTYWTMPWGDRANFYIDAVADSRRTIAILSAEDLWQAEQFHPADKRDFDQRPELGVYCCGESHKVRGWPCPTCETGYCPKCGNCQCQKHVAAEVLCSGSCFMQYLPHLLDRNGLCEECR
jgi:hypothetical protein